MTRTTLLGPLLAVLLLPAFASAQDDDVGRNVEAICCGASCCLIDLVCYATGEANPADACEICDPSSSQTSFSMDPSCVDAGPGDTDAGPGDTDAGPGGTDAGPGGTDAGPAGGTDAGPGGTMDAGPGEDDGGCSVGHGSSAAWPGLAVLALGLAFWRRRR